MYRVFLQVLNAVRHLKCIDYIPKCLKQGQLFDVLTISASTSGSDIYSM